MPLSIASFVMTICPSAITVPTERSIPAVRITSVWPIASTPTTITCCSTSERFWAWRKRSVLTEKNAIASTQRDERPDGRRGEHAQPELARAGSLPGPPLRWCRWSSRSDPGAEAILGAVGSGRDRGAGGRRPGRGEEGLD